MQSHPMPPAGVDVIETGRLLVIVGGGDMDGALLRALAAQGALVVAADGGADLCAAQGVTPDVIIGDLDSVDDPDGWAAPTRVVRLEEQQTTDFEKCLYMTSAPLTVALGVTGKRFDHTLAALDAVARYARGRRILLVDEVDLALAVSGSFGFDCAVGDRVSVHPLQKVTFASSQGLAYPLDGLTLAPGVRTGTSNAATDARVEIVPVTEEDGVWLLILDRSRFVPLMSQMGVPG